LIKELEDEDRKIVHDLKAPLVLPSLVDPPKPDRKEVAFLKPEINQKEIALKSQAIQKTYDRKDTYSHKPKQIIFESVPRHFDFEETPLDVDKVKSIFDSKSANL
jgi:hypothetical protein